LLAQSSFWYRQEFRNREVTFPLGSLETGASLCKVEVEEQRTDDRPRHAKLDWDIADRRPSQRSYGAEVIQISGNNEHYWPTIPLPSTTVMYRLPATEVKRSTRLLGRGQ
jgi:hypothetical protein